MMNSEKLKELERRICNVCGNGDYEQCQKCRVNQIVNELLVE